MKSHIAFTAMQFSSMDDALTSTPPYSKVYDGIHFVDKFDRENFDKQHVKH